MREEELIRERALTAIGLISESLGELPTDKPPADASGAVCHLLSYEIREQRLLWEHASEEWRAEVTAAAGVEQERIVSLTREGSSTTGGYLHFLRYRLGDFVLVAGIGGDLGSWAYRLLQLRTDDLEEVAALLTAIPDDERRRYVALALAPRSGAPIGRVAFVLDLARREFPADLSVETLLMLASRPEEDLAADAIVAAIGLGDTVQASVASAALSGISRLPPAPASKIARALIDRSPELVRVGSIAADRAPLVGAAAGPRGAELSEIIGSQLDALVDRESLRSWVAVLAELPTSHAIMQQAARSVVAASVGSDPETAALCLHPFLAEERFRDVLWTVLEAAPPDVLTRLIPTLLGLAQPDVAATRLGAALSDLTNGRFAAVRAAALDAVVEGQVEPVAMAGAWLARDKALAAADVVARIGRADVENHRLTYDMEDIDAAMRRELAEAALPIINYGSRIVGCQSRIQDVYRRLSEMLSSSESTEAKTPAPALSTPPDDLDEPRTDIDRLQLLFAVDSDDPDASGLPLAQLAAGGFAMRVVQDMFERGPMFQIAVRLSAATRSALLEAAMDDGLTPPPEWLDHPALGNWLRQELAQRGNGVSVGDGTDLEAVFQVAAGRFAVLEALRREVASKRGSVSRQVAGRLTPLFDELSAVVDSYYDVWRGLSAAGWSTVEVVGAVIRPGELDPSRHEIVSGGGSPSFIVRRPGVAVDGRSSKPCPARGSQGLVPLGIDLGTTNSSVAWSDEVGTIHSLSVRSGKEPFDAVIGSVVLDPLSAGSPVVGRSAFIAAETRGGPLLYCSEPRLQKQRLRETVRQLRMVETHVHDFATGGNAWVPEGRTEQQLYDEFTR